MLFENYEDGSSRREPSLSTDQAVPVMACVTMQEVVIREPGWSMKSISIRSPEAFAFVRAYYPARLAAIEALMEKQCR